MAKALGTEEQSEVEVPHPYVYRIDPNACSTSPRLHKYSNITDTSKNFEFANEWEDKTYSGWFYIHRAFYNNTQWNFNHA